MRPLCYYVHDFSSPSTLPSHYLKIPRIENAPFTVVSIQHCQFRNILSRKLKHFDHVSSGPVCVVSVAGITRQGKSFVLAEAFDQKGVFPLGHSFESETIGIWLWIVPDEYKVGTLNYTVYAGNKKTQVQVLIQYLLCY